MENKEPQIVTKIETGLVLSRFISRFVSCIFFLLWTQFLVINRNASHHWRQLWMHAHCVYELNPRVEITRTHSHVFIFVERKTTKKKYHLIKLALHTVSNSRTMFIVYSYFFYRYLMRVAYVFGFYFPFLRIVFDFFFFVNVIICGNNVKFI